MSACYKMGLFWRFFRPKPLSDAECGNLKDVFKLFHHNFCGLHAGWRGPLRPSSKSSCAVGVSTIGLPAACAP